MSSHIELGHGQTQRLAEAAARRARLAPLLSRVALAAAGGLIVVFVYQAGLFDPVLPKPQEPALTVEKPEQITGEKARIAGFDKQQQPYVITAERGEQDEADENLVHLFRIAATFHRAEGASNVMEAQTGLYDTRAKNLDLSGGVKITRDNRFTATMDKAHVNVETKDMVTDVPVVVELASGTIRANGMKISNNGKNVVFVNGVKAQFDQETGKGDGAP